MPTNIKSFNKREIDILLFEKYDYIYFSFLKIRIICLKEIQNYGVFITRKNLF